MFGLSSRSEKTVWEDDLSGRHGRTTWEDGLREPFEWTAKIDDLSARPEWCLIPKQVVKYTHIREKFQRKKI